MSFTLKSKITLGGIFLFALLLLVGIMSVYYINRLTNESAAILKDNYETLDYSRKMLQALEHFSDSAFTSRQQFETALAAQEKNITEQGEAELTAQIREAYKKLQGPVDSAATIQQIRLAIGEVIQLNLNAIEKKNLAAKINSEGSKAVIILILSASVLLSLTFLWNFPALVANPLARLTAGIKAIAAKNYSQRVHLNRSDEFGELANAFNSMAEKLDEYENSNLSRILFEKNRAETVIHSLKEASIGIGSNQTVLFANAEALQLLNLKEADIAGVAVETVQARNDLFRFLLQESGNIPFKIIVDGKENYFIKETTPISRSGEQLGELISLKNITPFKERDLAKTNFIATISHELKTPLASSDLSLKLLEDPRTGSLTQEQQELVQQLRDDNQRLLRILSELLDLSQVESGKIQLNVNPADPEWIVTKAINTVLNVAKEKEVKLEAEPVKAGLSVLADKEKTVWILNNFLTNAIRFSPAGASVTVKVNADGNQVCFEVIDEGPGIATEYQQRIFERFYSIPGNGKKGSGLGLAISKEFAEAMNGSITVKSKQGEGSTFTLYLPISS